MIVTVASGKGGTGKTTVAVSLAIVATSGLSESSVVASPSPALLREGSRQLGASSNGRGIALIDCDVEGPNSHLFLNPTIDERTVVGVLTPTIDQARCNLCGRCAEVCAYHAIAVLKHRALTFPNLCHGCGSCASNCPQDAIREQPRAIGVVETGRAGAIDFAQGVLDVGEPMAVPVIRELKRLAIADGSSRTVILDAPPGTACPVVTCLRGADYALLVTEPTPFGLHDLQLTVQVARNGLGLPVGVVVNRDGYGDDGVDNYCRAEGIPIVMRIPLDRRIATACSDGVPLVVELPEYRERFACLFRRILNGAEQ